MCSSMGVTPSLSPQVNNTILRIHTQRPNKRKCSSTLILSVSVKVSSARTTTRTAWGVGAHGDALLVIRSCTSHGVSSKQYRPCHPGVSTTVICSLPAPPSLSVTCDVDCPTAKTSPPRRLFPAELFPACFGPTTRIRSAEIGGNSPVLQKCKI